MEAGNKWDVLIVGALVFDGKGNSPIQFDVAYSGGRIVARNNNLNRKNAIQIIDGSGMWLMPGLIDIHTHFDLELEIESSLSESVRHGTTAVVIGNCSLGMSFGSLECDDNPSEEPVVDCFARVENVPKQIIRSSMANVSWQTTEEYLEHLSGLPLGPNVSPLLPHSMLRISVMGLEDSISRKPLRHELDLMEKLVRSAMEQGYVGMSTDMLPLHFLANDPHKNVRIPTQHASYKEIKSLVNILREYGRVWQTTPDNNRMLYSVILLALTSGRFYGKALKTTVLAALDPVANKRVINSILSICKLLNSKLVQGSLNFQALSAPFKIFSDGVITPLFEEKEPLRELISIESGDERKKLLKNPTFRKRFKKAWNHGRVGLTFSRLLRTIGITSTGFSCDLREMYVDSCPIASWSGLCVNDLYIQACGYREGKASEVLEVAVEQLFRKLPTDFGDEADFMIFILSEFDTEFRWYSVVANADETRLKSVLFHEYTIPGFNDSGAHISNMAFYDGNLRTLKLAQSESIEFVAKAVQKLTSIPADLFNIDAGSIEVGRRADLALINPKALEKYDSESSMEYIYRGVFCCKQLVNRSNEVVKLVVINGKIAWRDGQVSEELGREQFGRLLLDKDTLPVTESHKTLIKKQPARSVEYFE